ncbi:ABC transporter ATP-binding protein [Niveispirillum sp.]|uniref:ABC transporter ATP-binding protein n=1 Tax=Niveispirillum sp. TaxID=1917217 RepID=UPI001B5F301F|nr:ABC transporter ATP-binding protein [Niveispirillum sp.]MBP7339631.1 ABC transporter ATP-binding protein [Niveispirillum sp.]
MSISSPLRLVTRNDIPPADAAVRLRHLNRRFGDSNVLRDLSLDIGRSEFIALLGRSGSGKTTLLKLLAGIDQEAEGEIVTPANRTVVFQEPRLLPWKKVWENVALGLPAGDGRTRALAALAEVGLAHRVDAWPATLSGGEAQRAALARALVREPELLLLDEPFAALDALTRIRMHGLVEALWRTHRPSILLVTHDVDEALLLADRVLVLDHGRIALVEPVTAARPRSLSDPQIQAQRARLLARLGVTLNDEPTP